MNIKQLLKHFSKPDHLAFILMLPALLISKVLVAVLWIFVLAYDI